MTTSNPDDARVYVFVRLHAAPGRADAIRAALSKVVTASREESGCVRIDAFRSIRDPQLVFIQSVWKDAESFDVHATFTAHRRVHRHGRRSGRRGSARRSHSSDRMIRGVVNR
jgi:quinol monooxygenase YgiN